MSDSAASFNEYDGNDTILNDNILTDTFAFSECKGQTFDEGNDDLICDQQFEDDNEINSFENSFESLTSEEKACQFFIMNLLVKHLNVWKKQTKTSQQQRSVLAPLFYRMKAKGYIDAWRQQTIAIQNSINQMRSNGQNDYNNAETKEDLYETIQQEFDEEDDEDLLEERVFHDSEWTKTHSRDQIDHQQNNNVSDFQQVSPFEDLKNYLSIPSFYESNLYTNPKEQTPIEHFIPPHFLNKSANSAGEMCAQQSELSQNDVEQIKNEQLQKIYSLFQVRYIERPLIKWRECALQMKAERISLIFIISIAEKSLLRQSFYAIKQQSKLTYRKNTIQNLIQLYARKTQLKQSDYSNNTQIQQSQLTGSRNYSSYSTIHTEEDKENYSSSSNVHSKFNQNSYNHINNKQREYLRYISQQSPLYESKQIHTQIPYNNDSRLESEMQQDTQSTQHLFQNNYYPKNNNQSNHNNYQFVNSTSISTRQSFHNLSVQKQSLVLQESQKSISKCGNCDSQLKRMNRSSSTYQDNSMHQQSSFMIQNNQGSLHQSNSSNQIILNAEQQLLKQAEQFNQRRNQISNNSSNAPLRVSSNFNQQMKPPLNNNKRITQIQQNSQFINQSNQEISIREPRIQVEKQQQSHPIQQPNLPYSFSWRNNQSQSQSYSSQQERSLQKCDKQYKNNNKFNNIIPDNSLNNSERYSNSIPLHAQNLTNRSNSRAQLVSYVDSQRNSIERQNTQQNIRESFDGNKSQVEASYLQNRSEVGQNIQNILYFEAKIRSKRLARSQERGMNESTELSQKLEHLDSYIQKINNELDKDKSMNQQNSRDQSSLYQSMSNRGTRSQSFVQAKY